MSTSVMVQGGHCKFDPMLPLSRQLGNGRKRKTDAIAAATSERPAVRNRVIYFLPSVSRWTLLPPVSPMDTTFPWPDLATLVNATAVGGGSWGTVHAVPWREDCVMKHVPVSQRGDAIFFCLREALIGRSLSHHPNIATVSAIRLGLHGLCVGMKRYSGDMRSWACKRSSAVRVANLHSFTQSLVSAVVFMHANGIAHRDLKLSNLLYRAHPRGDNLSEVVVADFGLSRPLQAAPGGPFFSAEVMTLHYRPPELLFFDTPDDLPHRATYTLASDMWSVGVCLLEYLQPGVLDHVSSLADLRLFLLGNRVPVVPGDASAGFRLDVARLLSVTPQRTTTTQNLAASDVPLIDETIVAIISQCLCFLPEQRLSAQGTLDQLCATGNRSALFALCAAAGQCGRFLVPASSPLSMRPDTRRDCLRRIAQVYASMEIDAADITPPYRIHPLSLVAAADFFDAAQALLVMEAHTLSAYTGACCLLGYILHSYGQVSEWHIYKTIFRSDSKVVYRAATDYLPAIHGTALAILSILDHLLPPQRATPIFDEHTDRNYTWQCLVDAVSKDRGASDVQNIEYQ
jgi:serine/threonine protein kinase